MTKKHDPENVRVLQKLRSGNNRGRDIFTYKLGVPAWVRRLLGIDGGDNVEYVQEGDRIYIRRAEGDDREK